MKSNNVLLAICLIVGSGAISSCAMHAHAIGHGVVRPNTASFTKSLAGYKVRLVAVSDNQFGPQIRVADHAWTPDGAPYQGPEARIAMRTETFSPNGGVRRSFFFELQEPQQKTDSSVSVTSRAPWRHQPRTPIDAFSYLPRNSRPTSDTDQLPGEASPVAVQVWHGVLRDSSGAIVLSQPFSFSVGLGADNSESQPIVFGIAKGEFKVIAIGRASLAKLAEGETAILASGVWGKIEATHLRPPMAQSKPSPTHRFRLIGGTFPPKMERRVVFYDAKGAEITHCGDGPNNPGSAGYTGRMFLPSGGLSEIDHYEVQERPYAFVQFDKVCLEPPLLYAHSGKEGTDHFVETPIGNVVGLLKSTNDGPWRGNVLFAADGKRWIDPGIEMAGYEYGQFDPSNHPQDNRWNILLEPIHEFSDSTTPISCEVYAADSSDGPKKELLSSWRDIPFRTPMTTIPCSPTTRPYVRIEARVGDSVWKSLETIPVTDEMKIRAASGSPGSAAIAVSFYDNGAIKTVTNGSTYVQAKATWSPKNEQVRVVAHLKDGSIANVDFNTAGYSGNDPTKNKVRGLEYSRQSNGTQVMSAGKTIDFKTIVSFDIQSQEFTHPLIINLRSPIE